MSTAASPATGDPPPDDGPPASERPWGAEPPAPLGDGAASQTVGQTAAPLLAGFCVALVGVVGQNPESFWGPGLAMVVLLGAAVALLFSVQAALCAQQHYWTREDWIRWYPPEAAATATERSFRSAHRIDMAQWTTWRKRTGTSYNAGVLLLGLGVAAVAAPPASYGDQPLGWTEFALRVAASGVALTGVAAESIWWARSTRSGSTGRRA